MSEKTPYRDDMVPISGEYIRQVYRNPSIPVQPHIGVTVAINRSRHGVGRPVSFMASHPKVKP